MPHKLRYARQGGYRRFHGGPELTKFGYGGAGYGGWGRKGKYGGYRSSYRYPPQRHVYNTPKGPPENTSQYERSRRTTFFFAMIILAIVGLGLFFGRRNARNRNPFIR